MLDLFYVNLYNKYKRNHEGGQVQLITILLVLTAILSFASGIAVYAGSRKAEKKASKFFALAAFFAALWTIAIAIFSAIDLTENLPSPLIIGLVYIPSMFMDVCLIFYCGYPYKLVRYFGVCAGMVVVVLSTMIISSPTLINSRLVSSPEFNSVKIRLDWYNYTYALFFLIGTLVILASLYFRYKKARNKGAKQGILSIGVGMLISSVLMLIFDVIMLMRTCSMAWVGALAISIAMIGHYYAVLRYRTIQLSNTWLKILSYAIIVTSAATVYMLIFYVIFTALFKVPNPSPAIFVLNFIMITIVLLLLPVMNELSSFVKSLILTNQVDVAYIVKKMNHMTTNVNLNELSDFLADHMHFTYIGILMKGKLYGSDAMPLTAAEMKQFALLPEPTRGIWQEFNEPTAEISARNDIKAVALLLDAKGKPFGQLIVGKPQGKMGFERKDLIQLEMIINLVAAIIDTRAK